MARSSFTLRHGDGGAQSEVEIYNGQEEMWF